MDAAFVKAPLGGEDSGPNPTDRGKSGSKHHILAEGHGIPLYGTTTAANVPEIKRVIPLVVETRRGRRKGSRSNSRTNVCRSGLRFGTYRDLLRGWGSSRCSPVVARIMAVAWASIAGWSSERYRGCTVWVDCVVGCPDRRRFMMRCYD